MGRFFNWVERKSNTINTLFTVFNTLLAVLGIVVAIYGIVHVPDFIQEMKSQKILNVNKSLIETVQEIIYNKQELKTQDLETFIKGKELKYGIIYPYSTNELLIQTQESFMDVKFIPLGERIKWVDTISTVQSLIKPSVSEKISKVTKNKQEQIFPSPASILFIILGVLFGILGFYSIVARNKKEEKIKTERDGAIREIKQRVNDSFNFLLLVEKTLQTLEWELYIPPDQTDVGYDFKIKTDKGAFFIECSTRLSDDDIHRVLYSSVKFIGETILVLKETPPASFMEQIRRHTLNNAKNPIHLVLGDNESMLREEFLKILKR